MKPVSIQGWAGFVNGRVSLNDSMNMGYGHLYRTKNRAQKFYEDVLRVEIKEVIKCKKKR